MAKKFTLGKTERLKSRKAIEKLFKNGKDFGIAPFRVMYQQITDSGLHFGVGVSARNFRKAVDRNRIKRLTREAYRLQKIPLQQLISSRKKGMNIFFTYMGNEIPDYITVSAAVEKCINKLMNKIGENSAPHT